jgi:hypothetical protein
MPWRPARPFAVAAGATPRNGRPVDRVSRGHSVSRHVSLAIVAGALVALPALERARDSRNVRALARHVGCSEQTAWGLYRLSRRHGYGAAYRRTFPGQAIPHKDPFDVPIRPH